MTDGQIMLFGKSSTPGTLLNVSFYFKGLCTHPLPASTSLNLSKSLRANLPQALVRTLSARGTGYGVD